MAFTFFEKRMLTIFFTCCIIYFAVTAWSFKEEIARSENSGKFQKVFEKSKYQKFLKAYLEFCLFMESILIYQFNYVYRVFVSFFFSYAIKFS